MFGKSALPITLDPTAANDAAPSAPALPPAMAQQPMPAPPVASPAPQDVSAPQAPATGAMPTPASVNPVARGLDALLFHGAFGAAKDVVYQRQFAQWHMQQLAQYGASLPDQNIPGIGNPRQLFFANPDAFIATANKNAERYVLKGGESSENPMAGGGQGAETTAPLITFDNGRTVVSRADGSQTISPNVAPGTTKFEGGVGFDERTGRPIFTASSPIPGGPPPTVVAPPGSPLNPNGQPPAPPAPPGAANGTPTAFSGVRNPLPFAVPRNANYSQADVPPDVDALVRTAYAEGDPSPIGWQSVAAVAMNRAKASGQAPSAVVAQPGQFEGYGNSRYKSLKAGSPQYTRILAAIQPVIQGGDPTGGADSYYAPRVQAQLGRPKPQWDDGSGQQIGTQLFFRGKYGGAPSPTGTPAQGGQAQSAPPAGAGTTDANGNYVLAGGGQTTPLYTIKHGSEVPGGDPSQDYQVDNATGQATVAPRAFNMDVVQSNRKAFYGSESYKNATENLAPIKGLFDTVSTIAPSGVVSMAALDTLNKSLNPGGIVRPTSVNLFLDHLGLPEDLKSQILGVTGNGFLSPKVIAQTGRASWLYARSHIQQASDMAQRDTAIAVAHGFKPEDVGETAPSLPPVPGWAQDPLPPVNQRVQGQTYWSPKGPAQWTGKGWVLQ